jgi:hypothetical protein
MTMAQTFARVLNKIFNLNDEMNERFSKAMRNNRIFTSRSVVCAVTCRSLTWSRHVTEVGETEIQNKMLMEKRLWKRPNGRTEREVCDTIKI